VGNHHFIAAHDVLLPGYRRRRLAAQVATDRAAKELTATSITIDVSAPFVTAARRLCKQQLSQGLKWCVGLAVVHTFRADRAARGMARFNRAMAVLLLAAAWMAAPL
jgi:hypothetical protein